MGLKNSTEIIICGKKYTLSGVESEEHLKKVASYLNAKLDECSESSSYQKLNTETKSILIALNIADDYLKNLKKLGTLEEKYEMKERELYDIKHELISAQIKLDNSEALIDQLKDDNLDLKERNSELETEIKMRKKK